MTRKYTDPISNFERLAAELRSLRRERRMSQQTLADRAGVSRRTITNAEGGQNVGLHELCRIANALGGRVPPCEMSFSVFAESCS